MVRTRVGYCGGKKKDPTYRKIGDHTESIQIDYDPTKITYERLLEVFWAEHDPTVRSFSRQYQGFVFTRGDAQAKTALASRERVAKQAKGTIQTEIVEIDTFWPAEDYHQKYALRNDALLWAEFHAIYPSETDLRESTAAARVNGWLGGSGTLLGFRKVAADLGLSDRARAHLETLVVDRGGSGPSCGTGIEPSSR